MKTFFTEARNLIAQEKFDQLKNLKVEKPEYFNWVEEIFHGINVIEAADDQALLWKYNDQEISYSYKELYQLANRLLNMLRKHNVHQGDKIYSMLPLVPANWISFLATIKGGFVLMPAPTNLSSKDLFHRFESLFPEVFIADISLAETIDQAEKDFKKKMKLKICVGGQRDGWVSFDNLFDFSHNADVAKTRSDDAVLYFFTSGTTGLPKIVVHTHFTYPVGHLTTASWIGCRKGDLHYNISSPGWAKFAWSSFFAPWNMGATIFANQTDKFVPAKILATMEEYKVSSFCGSPTVLRMLIQHNIADYNLSLRTRYRHT